MHLTAVSPITLCLFYKEKSNDAEMEAWFSLEVTEITDRKGTKPQSLARKHYNPIPIF